MKIVVIGNGMVGYKFCEKLITSSSTHNITVFGEEIRPAYDRVHLSEFFAGKTADDLSMASSNWYADNNITLHLGDPILHIDRVNKTVTSFKGLTLSYEILIMATGSAAFVPTIPGTEKQGVFIYRTIEDLEMMAAHAPKAKTGAVIGGGLLGLEAAKAMLDLGISETHVIEFAPRLMPRQIDDAGSAVLTKKLESLGLIIHTNTNTTRIDGDDAIKSMHFADGSTIQVDMLVISAGIKPRDELAVKSDLEVGPRGGIIVNNFLQTSDPSIYAIGECALHGNMIYGLVAPGYEMAQVAIAHINNIQSPHPNTETAKQFAGFDMSTKLKLIGTDVASFGNAFADGDDVRVISITDNNKNIYKRINISNDGKTLLGGILVGDATEYNMLLQTCKNNMALPPNPEEIILGKKGTEENAGAGVQALPNSALICSCEGVTKEIIVNAVANGEATTINDIKKCCKAGTGCGGCIPMVKDLINYSLQAQGKVVRNVLCEHFQHSRQELFDLIKIKQLKSYEEVLNTLGTGHGCETCKPAIVSILASLWNEMPLKKGNATAQDTNDRFLANIQKGGTYSVVPRIPGGEITPDKLIVIGEVAKKYNLYTKITGGQRIDLFGAHVGDLPAIWETLIAAGFESGQAYGKSLRTVKSCVGSTWCRFGLHDSVSFAIEIEERYRGLRSPHKLKSAVSGCIRECAEAQSKDFGIIATEKGWNLYVCGNGGSKPQHALLLASDIDSPTVIKFIDRFLMFYIKTADPLTRTATWLNKMEGGIDYLKSVVIDDALGLCQQWEQEMQQHVNTYECEWKVAVETPEIRKKFAHFVNAPEVKDPTIAFDDMRSMKKAKDWK